MGLAGVLVGLKGQDNLSDLWFTALSTAWAAGIGFGLGSIFSQRSATKWVPIYWAGTLALVGPIFAFVIDSGIQPDPSVLRQVVVGLAGSIVGIVLGLVFGKLQLRRLGNNRIQA
jgi:hypothetical protein